MRTNLTVSLYLGVLLAGGFAHAATFSTLGSFDSANGANPTNGLYADATGTLFGTTYAGGPSNRGTFFKITPGGSITTVTAAGATGYGRFSGTPVADTTGNLFGIADDRTGGDYGKIVKLTPGGVLSTVATFTGPNGGSPSGLSIDTLGNLYGTSYGDIAQITQGTVFKIAKASGVLSTLATFDGYNGHGAQGGVVADGAGNLFGTTTGSYGTQRNYGTIFKIATDGTLVTLATFDVSQGSSPNGLIADVAGNLYGTTTAGGASLKGTIFKFSKTGGLTVLASFSGNDGATPEGKLLIDAAGNLFGTTYAGGAFNAGTIFELPKGGTLTTLKSFKDADGQHPIGELIADASGILYGTTFVGGARGQGTVFDIANSGFVTFGTGAVPEPATWALMIVGFGIVGSAARQRRKQVLA